MAGYEQGIMRVLAESRSQPELEGIGALPALASIVNRQRSQRLLIAYLVHVTGGDPALPQKVAFAFDRISAILELPGDGPIEPHPDAEVRQLVEAIRVARDAIRQCADQLGAMEDTDEALIWAAGCQVGGRDRGSARAGPCACGCGWGAGGGRSGEGTSG
jgi:hypothetical protein